MSYWDTSCLIKLYTPEPDSALFRARLAIEASCLTADFAPLEFWATVRRKETEGMLAPGEALAYITAMDHHGEFSAKKRSLLALKRPPLRMILRTKFIPSPSF